MLKLDLKTEAYWLDLPGKVKVKVLPITTAIMSAAQSLAVDRYRASVTSGLTDAENEAMRKGETESLLITALAELSIIEWQGVYAASGDAPAVLTPETISQLMQLWLIAQEFLKQYVTQFRLLDVEGNVSAPAANGILAAEAPIAANAS